jgi:hypothetical protein
MGNWVLDACLVTLVVVAARATTVALRQADERRADRAARIALIAIKTISAIVVGAGVEVVLFDFSQHEILVRFVEDLLRTALVVVPPLGLP